MGGDAWERRGVGCHAWQDMEYAWGACFQGMLGEGMLGGGENIMQGGEHALGGMLVGLQASPHDQHASESHCASTNVHQIGTMVETLTVLQFTGQINLPKTGLWSFSLNSDDGSILYIDGAIFINNDGGCPLPISQDFAAIITAITIIITP